MEKTVHFDRCCNPFNLDRHKIKKSLRLASEDIQTKFGLSRFHYLCINCRYRILKEIKESSENSSQNRSGTDNNNDSSDDSDNNNDNISIDNGNHNNDSNDSEHDNSKDSNNTIADNNDRYELEKSLGKNTVFIFSQLQNKIRSF